MNAPIWMLVLGTLAQAEPAVVEPVVVEPAVVEPAVGAPTGAGELEPTDPASPWLAPVASPAPRVAVRAGGSAWRLGAGLGQAWTWSDSPRWTAGLGDPVGRLRLERELEQLLPGLAANVGLNAWNQGELEGGAELRLWVMDLALGASFTWPRDGLWRVAFPYVRAALLFSYVQARAAGDLGADLWGTPGLEGAAGLRVHLGRAAHAGWGRLFVFGEGSLDLRWPRRIRLERPEEDEDPLLPAAPTRLGRLNLSGWGWQLGAGMVF